LRDYGEIKLKQSSRREIKEGSTCCNTLFTACGVYWENAFTNTVHQADTLHY